MRERKREERKVFGYLQFLSSVDKNYHFFLLAFHFVYIWFCVCCCLYRSVYGSGCQTHKSYGFSFIVVPSFAWNCDQRQKVRICTFRWTFIWIYYLPLPFRHSMVATNALAFCNHSFVDGGRWSGEKRERKRKMQMPKSNPYFYGGSEWKYQDTTVIDFDVKISKFTCEAE